MQIEFLYLIDCTDLVKARIRKNVRFWREVLGSLEDNRCLERRLSL
jgi:hypothetical protein